MPTPEEKSEEKPAEPHLKSDDFVLFVSCVPGKLVARYGTGSQIGAVIGPKGVVFDEKVIVPISQAELDLYRREYRKAFKNGDLKRRRPEEFDAWMAEHLAAAPELKHALEVESESKTEPPPEPTAPVDPTGLEDVAPLPPDPESKTEES